MEDPTIPFLIGCPIFIAVILITLRLITGAWIWQPDPVQVEIAHYMSECTFLHGIYDPIVGVCLKDSAIIILK